MTVAHCVAVVFRQGAGQHGLQRVDRGADAVEAGLGFGPFRPDLGQPLGLGFQCLEKPVIVPKISASVCIWKSPFINKANHWHPENRGTA